MNLIQARQDGRMFRLGAVIAYVFVLLLGLPLVIAYSSGRPGFGPVGEGAFWSLLVTIALGLVYALYRPGSHDARALGLVRLIRLAITPLTLVSLLLLAYLVWIYESNSSVNMGRIMSVTTVAIAMLLAPFLAARSRRDNQTMSAPAE